MIDTIWIEEGTYTATNAVIPAGGTNVLTLDKPLTLRAWGRVAKTIIDGEATNRCIYNASASTFALHGMTLTNGRATRGDAIYFDVHGNPAHFQNTVFLQNGPSGGCIWIRRGVTTFRNCLFLITRTWA